MEMPTPAPTGPAADASRPQEVTGAPGCDTGPGGRVVFLARELSAAMRRRRARTTSRGTGSSTTTETR